MVREVLKWFGQAKYMSGKRLIKRVCKCEVDVEGMEAGLLRMAGRRQNTCNARSLGPRGARVMCVDGDQLREFGNTTTGAVSA